MNVKETRADIKRGPQFDAFLSHNSGDKPVVRELADALAARGIRSWLDERELVPGRPWQEALEEIIRTTNTAVVLLGPTGVGPWEEPEMRACLNEFVDRDLPVIPVLLPGAPRQPYLPLFLRAFTWVDLRCGLTNAALDRLEWGITGRRTGAMAVIVVAYCPTDHALARRIGAAFNTKTNASPLLKAISEGIGDVRETESSDYWITVWSSETSGDAVAGQLTEATMQPRDARGPFFITMRTESATLPPELHSRFVITLEPSFESAIDELVAIVHSDRDALILTKKALTTIPRQMECSHKPIEIYICSAVFDRTIVFAVRSDTSASAVLRELIDLLNLPSKVSHQDRVGVSLRFHLRGPKGRLSETEPLLSQGVRAHAVVFLEVELSVFATGIKVGGTAQSAVYRGKVQRGATVSRRHKNQALFSLANKLSALLRRVGLRNEAPLTVSDLEPFVS